MAVIKFFFRARNFKLKAKHQLYFSVGWWSSTSPRTSSGQTISKLFLQGDVGRGVDRQSGEIIHFLNNCVQNVFVELGNIFLRFFFMTFPMVGLGYNFAIKSINRLLLNCRALRRLKGGTLSNSSSTESLVMSGEPSPAASPCASPSTARRADLLQSSAKLNLLEEKLKQEFTGSSRLLL